MNNSYSKPILIAGGYGVVGKQVVEILQARHPHIPIWVGGRNPSSVKSWLARFKNVQGVTLDLDRPQALNQLNHSPGAVISMVNDPDSKLLTDSLDGKLPFLDVTRWTRRMQDGIQLAALKGPLAPVMFGSAWMAGVPAMVAKAMSARFREVSRLDIDILFAMADKAGPNSAEYMDRLSIPFELTHNGKPAKRMPFTEPKTVRFPGGYQGKVYRFDVPDQLTLPKTTGAKSVNGRIGFDDASATGSLAFMARSGIMKLLSHSMFDGLRRGMLYNPGEGAAHEVIVEIEGVLQQGSRHKETVSIVAPKGQTHLTACGTVIQIERLLGLNNLPALPAGIHFPDQAPDQESALSLLTSEGVKVNGVDCDEACSGRVSGEALPA